MADLLAADLEGILDHTRPLWGNLRGKRLFITGGTGFFGHWLIESFLWADKRLGLGSTAFVLTRNPEEFRRKSPQLVANPAIQLVQGDVRNFSPPAGHFVAIIHAATESSSGLNERDPLQMLDVVINGTRHVLDFAIACGVDSFLLTSSGAVYGRQPPDLTHLPEDYEGGLDPVDVRSAYAEGKRVAELICSIYSARHGLKAKIARGFAFVGPYLPLSAHFAVGNFIRDALAGRPIRVQGDGTPYRSYLYGADLAIWLWTILLRGEPARPYNVGSEQGVSIRDLALLVAKSVAPSLQVTMAQAQAPEGPPKRYVPSTRRAREELGLQEYTSLSEALDKTLRWHRALAVEP